MKIFICIAGCLASANITKTNKDRLIIKIMVYVRGKNLSVSSPKYKEPIYALTLGFQRSFLFRYKIIANKEGKTKV